jgi:hypothetical protein
MAMMETINSGKKMVVPTMTIFFIKGDYVHL